MTRDEVLTKVQSEGKKTDEMQRHVTMYSRSASRFVGMIMCAFIWAFAESKHLSLVALSIYACMFSTEGFVDAITYKKKHYPIIATLFALAFLAFLVIFFSNVMWFV